MAKASVRVPLRPWAVPGYATLDLPADNASVSVSVLTQGEIDLMVWLWIEEVYKKAGKRNPFFFPPGEAPRVG